MAQKRKTDDVTTSFLFPFNYRFQTPQFGYPFFSIPFPFRLTFLSLLKSVTAREFRDTRPLHELLSLPYRLQPRLLSLTPGPLEQGFFFIFFKCDRLRLAIRWLGKRAENNDSRSLLCLCFVFSTHLRFCRMFAPVPAFPGPRFCATT